AARHRLLRAADRRRRRCPQVRQSAGTEGTTLQVEGEERHLHLLLWRAEPRRDLLLQTKTLSPRWQDDFGEDILSPPAQKPGARCRAEVEIQAVRAMRQVGQRPLPAPRHLR